MSPITNSAVKEQMRQQNKSQLATNNITDAIKPQEFGTKYFSRYSMKIPAKSVGKRKPISIPFAIDEDDNVISCSYENGLFAAYITGAAGSGKSTLLHTIISGLIMNYHPDEVELC